MKEWRVTFKTSGGEVTDEIIIKAKSQVAAEIMFEMLTSYPMCDIEEVTK
jgi:hypothetical protein